MGVQKDIEVAKKLLDIARLDFDRPVPEPDKGRVGLQTVQKKIGEIVKALEGKKKQAAEGLKKLNDAVKVVDDALDKTPFDGAKALAAIKKATDAAAGAEQAAAPK